MRFFSKWFGGRSGPLDDHKGWQQNLPQIPAVTNSQTYSPDQSLQVSTVYACVDLLSRTVASLPCDVLKIGEDGTVQKDKTCNLAFILTESPNYQMTPYDFISTLVAQWALRGNAYALITRKTDKTVKSLRPLNPDQMQVFVDDAGHLVYRYYTADNKITDYKAEEVLHWKGMGNGLIGLSKLEYMRAAVAENLQSQEMAIDLYGNLGKPKGILTVDHILSDKQKDEVASQFAYFQRGGIPVLPADMKFTQLSLTPQETQLLETRKFSVQEICRWFGVPPSLVNSESSQNGATLEQITANFYKTTILPMCIGLEQSIMKRLPCLDEKLNHQVRFRLSFLNRASDKDRFQIYAQAVQNGLKTRNEVRQEEGLAPMEGADDLTVQTNLSKIQDLGLQNVSQVSQTPLTTEPQKQ